MFVLHPEDLRQRGGLSEVEPRGVVLVEAEVAAKQEKRRHDGGRRRRFGVLVAFPHPKNFVEESDARRVVNRRPARALRRRRALRNLHARLDHHERAKGSDQAIGLDGTFETRGHLLHQCAVQDGHGRIHMLEEEIDASIDHIRTEQAWRPSEAGGHGWEFQARQSMLQPQGQVRVLLSLPQLRNNLGSAPFRTFFLRDGIVGTHQGRLTAIATRMHAVAAYLIPHPVSGPGV